MALKDIFTMVKADRYTADGCEGLNKAREADVEDRRYNIGEISEKTGLQKTANGWVKPKNGKQPGAKQEEPKNVHGAEVDKIYERQLKRIKELKAKGFTDEQIDNDKIIKQTKEDMKNVGKKPKTENKSALKLPDEKSSFATDVNRMKKLKKEDYKQYTIQLEKLHSKYPINKWKDLLNKTTQDEAPRVLTGDTRIRVRKA